LSFALLSVQTSNAKIKSGVLGLSLGMTREEATRQLQEIGNLEKNETKLQEVWVLTNDK